MCMFRGVHNVIKAVVQFLWKTPSNFGVDRVYHRNHYHGVMTESSTPDPLIGYLETEQGMKFYMLRETKPE